MRKGITAFFIAVLLLSSALCVKAAGRGKINITGTFSGRIPCADCEGIIYTIKFRPDSTYLSEMRYLGAEDGKDGYYYETGKWKVLQGKLILFSAGRQQGQYRIVNRSRLRMLDADGKEIKTGLNYDIRRTYRNFNPKRPFSLTGMYSYYADAAVFTDCNTGVTYPVAEMPQNAEVQSSYLSLRKVSNEKLMLKIKGYISFGSNMEGKRKEQVFIAEFEGFEPGKDCR